MIVTCPVCSTRYLVDPRALGVAGRVVRCANCTHTWHQAPPDDAPRRIDLSIPQPEIVPRPSDRVQLPALRPMPRRRSWSAFGWLLLFLALAGIGAGGMWRARDQIIAYWPTTAHLYAMFGVPMAAPQSNFELKVTTSRDTENGLPTLIIQGEVTNVSKVAREVPKLKVVLQDGAKNELQSWSISITSDRLLPGASVPFRTSVTEPSEAAAHVLVTLEGG